MTGRRDTSYYEEQAEQALHRFAMLRERGGTLGENDKLVAEVLEELSIALHELQVSAQELSDQNEALLAAEGTIAEERERYVELYNFAPDGYLVTDTHGVVRDCNRVIAELLGRAPTAIVGRPLVMFVPMPLRRPVRLLVARMAEADPGLQTLETVLTRKDKTTLPVVARVIAATSARSSGRALELRWTLRDISGEKETRRALVDEAHHRLLAEDALLGSEALYRHLVEYATDIVYELDQNGRFMFCNEQAMHRILGYMEKELIGRKLLDIVRPDYRKSVAAFNAALLRKRNAHSYIEFAVLAKDGREVWLGQHAAGVLIADKGSSLQAICRDITTQVQRVEQLERAGERWRDLSAHLQKEIEAERARIAREVHDELGAALTIARMELSLPADGGPAPANGDRNESLLKRIDAAIEAVRRICSDLRPSLLDNLGLGAAIEWLAQDVQERTKIHCEVRLDGIPAGLDQERATALFRIVQEAVTNTIRHAKASKLTIRQRIRDDDVVIEVSDDGRGIKPEQQVGRHAYGIVGMHERAKALGGTVRVHGGKHGTQVSVHMPRSPTPPKVRRRKGESNASPRS